MKTIKNKRFNEMFIRTKDEYFRYSLRKNMPQTYKRFIKYVSDRYEFDITAHTYGLDFRISKTKEAANKYGEGRKENLENPMFVPDIYITQKDWEDKKSGEAKVQTTSGGSVNEKDMNIIIEGYIYAKHIISVINEALPEIIDSWTDEDKKILKTKNKNLEIAFYEEKQKEIDNLTEEEKMEKINDGKEGDILVADTGSLNCYEIIKVNKKSVNVRLLNIKSLSYNMFIPVGGGCHTILNKKINFGYIKSVKINGETFEKWIDAYIYNQKH